MVDLIEVVEVELEVIELLVMAQVHYRDQHNIYGEVTQLQLELVETLLL